MAESKTIDEGEPLLSLGTKLDPGIAYLAVSKKGSRLKPEFLLTLTAEQLKAYDFFVKPT